MLQQMRKFAKSKVAAVLMGLLALSFGVWGIADIFTGNADTTVATVGDVAISQDAFQHEYQNLLRTEGQQLGTQLSSEQAQALGLPQQALGLGHGLVVTDVRAGARGAGVRRGDILLRVVQHGRQSELTSPAQLAKLLAGLDRDTAITFYVRRGERASFVTIAGFADKG